MFRRGSHMSIFELPCLRNNGLTSSCTVSLNFQLVVLISTCRVSIFFLQRQSKYLYDECYSTLHAARIDGYTLGSCTQNRNIYMKDIYTWGYSYMHVIQ
jgi:hypothetical protein